MPLAIKAVRSLPKGSLYEGAMIAAGRFPTDAIGHKPTWLRRDVTCLS